MFSFSFRLHVIDRIQSVTVAFPGHNNLLYGIHNGIDIASHLHVMYLLENFAKILCSVSSQECLSLGLQQR